jgi:hypothetical protein
MKFIKTFTIILCLLIAASAFGQTNDVKKPTNVSHVDSLTRDTKFLSIGDVYRIYETFSDKVTVKDGRVFENILQAILNQAVAEYYDKQKQLPKK